LGNHSSRRNVPGVHIHGVSGKTVESSQNRVWFICCAGAATVAGTGSFRFFVHIEVANLLLKRGAREDALGEYSAALKYAPDDRLIRGAIEGQIQRLKAQPQGSIPALRNPFME
jgi:hypothetical protein